MKNIIKFSVIILTYIVCSCISNVYGITVSEGENLSDGKNWKSFSIHTREDGGIWEDTLVKAGWVYMNPLNTKKSYGENAKVTTQTFNSFTMNVTSTGWGAMYGGANGNEASNPWGITVSKLIDVERGRYYTISFKIKSTLQNEILEEKERSDGTGYNVGTGKYNYIKHIYFGVYNDKDSDSNALPLSNFSATIGEKNVLVTKKVISNKEIDSFITLDSRNDGWVTVASTVLIPFDSNKSDNSQFDMAIEFAFGAFIEDYPEEHNMSGTIEVKDFEVLAGEKVILHEKSNQSITAKSKTIVYGTKPFNLNAVTNGDGQLTYTSSNNKVATVNKEGKVTVKGYGNSNITIKASETKQYNSAVKTISIKVLPKKMVLKNVISQRKKKLMVTWQKDSSVTGYQVYFSTRKNFKRDTYVRTYNKNTTKMSIIALKSKKTYYIKIRSYKKVGKTKYYGAWSKIRSVKIK